MADPMLAEIKLFGGNYAPQNWAYCWGQLMQISECAALFSLLGTQFGGDGRVTFGLPDLRGRVALGSGSGPGRTPRSIGMAGGYEHVVLAQQQMPSHTHENSGTVSGNLDAKLKCYNSQGTGINPKNSVLAQQGLSVAPDAKVYYSGEANQDMHSSAISITAQSLEISLTIDPAGGSQTHENMPPWQCLNYIIALQGYYPPRS